MAKSSQPPLPKVVTLHGPPVTRELQQAFGCFGQVTGVIILPHEKGTIRVSYESGLSVAFVPVFDGSRQ